MKAEHRHQLHKNLLADRMEQLYRTVKSGPTKTSGLVWVFVLLALGSILVWQLWKGATQTNSSAQWTEVDVATHDPRVGPEHLAQIGADSQGTLAGRTAQFQSARLLLQNGLGSIMAFQHKSAVANIKSALKLYAELAPQCPDAPILEQEALMGVAKARESLIGVPAEEKEDKDLEYGSLDQAKAAYQKLVDKFPKSPLGKEAANRLQELQAKGPAIAKFYEDKLKAAAPEPALPNLPEPFPGITPPKPEPFPGFSPPK
jgi:hypothetical protein